MEPSEIRFSASEYVRAFEAISRQLTERHRAILAAHYAAHEHAATSGELARAMGYQSRQPLNKSLQHLAELLSQELGLRVPDPIVVLASVEQNPGTEPRMTLRPAVVSALEALRWT